LHPGAAVDYQDFDLELHSYFCSALGRTGFNSNGIFSSPGLKLTPFLL